MNAQAFTFETFEDSQSNTEEFSPEVERILKALDVPVEILDFDYGTNVH